MTKLDATIKMLELLANGVQDPAVIDEGAGEFDAIPGAHFRDISYTGSRESVYSIHDESDVNWDEFDVHNEEHRRDVAEWIVAEW